MKGTFYSIKDLEVLSGIKSHTIRIWEKRFQLFTPDRTETNIRYYSDDDLRKLLNVSMLLKHGFRISKIASLDHSKIKEIIVNFEDKSSKTTEISELFVLHMANFDVNAFSQLTSEVIEKFGIEQAFHEVFFPLMHKIGMYWQVGSIFPAQEHYVSNLLRQKMIAEIDKLRIAPYQNKTILFFLRENEMHELSLLYYSYCAVKQGYTVIYLGQNVPIEDLEKINTVTAIHFVFTSFVNSITLNGIKDYLNTIKKIFSNKKILITGRQVQLYQQELPKGFFMVDSPETFNSITSG